MKRETITRMLNGLDDRYVSEAEAYLPEAVQESPERISHMKKKRILTFALAAALILLLGAAAYASWSVHTVRQQELKADFGIEENKVDSYVEYAVPDGQGQGLVLLSAVNDGREQRVYVNISPVSEEEAAAFPDKTRFVWCIEGTEIGGSAAPQLPVELSLSGTDEIRAAVMEHAYDKETQTLTLQGFLDVNMVERAMTELGTDAVPLAVQMLPEDGEPRSFGPVPFALTGEQSRVFDFGRAVYHDEELDKDIEIIGLELTPFSAVWKVSYEGAASFHTPEADWAAYEPWSLLEDKICIEAEIVFSDGSAFSTGGALTTPYKDGAVHLTCGWGGAIDIDDVQRIVLGDLVLWERK